MRSIATALANSILDREVRMKFSVALATYNGERYLEQQLSSIALQSHLPCEIQVGDDSSTDSTIAILERFAATAAFPVHVSRNKPSLGYGENFMRTAAKCSGDWIAFCDQDDVWFPGKLETCEGIIRSASDDLMLVVHNAVVTDQDLNPKIELDRGPFGKFKRLTLSPYKLAHGFRQVFRAKPMMDLSSGERSLGWLSSPQSHDMWVTLLASLIGDVIISSDKLAYYRRHDQTSSALPVANPRATTKRVLANNCDALRSEGQAFFAFAARLRDSARNTADTDLRLRLDQAALEIEARASRVSRRASIYAPASRYDRLRSFWGLANGGDYGLREGWQLNPRSALKDLIFAAVG